MLRVAGAEVSSVRRVGSALEVRVFNPTAAAGAGRHRPSHRLARRSDRTHRVVRRGFVQPRPVEDRDAQVELTSESNASPRRRLAAPRRVQRRHTDRHGLLALPEQAPGEHRATAPRTRPRPNASGFGARRGRHVTTRAEGSSASRSFAGRSIAGEHLANGGHEGERSSSQRLTTSSSRSTTRSMSAAARRSPIASSMTLRIDQGSAVRRAVGCFRARSATSWAARAASRADRRSDESFESRQRAAVVSSSSRGRRATPRSSCARASAKPPGNAPGASIRSPRSSTADATRPRPAPRSAGVPANRPCPS